MIRSYFHRWEQQLADISRNDRVVRPFEWGEDWIDPPSAIGHRPSEPSANSHQPSAMDRVSAWVERVMQDTDAFYTPPPTRYTFTKSLPSARAAGEEGLLTFDSGLNTPHPENNVVRARFFPPDPIRKPRRGTTAPRRAVVVLAQWNSDAEGHVGLCKVLAKLGIASLRISLPYHDQRMPPELTRADYIVSANIVRTLQVCRQAVRDVRLALWWLRDQGYDRLGLLGTSLGSCLSLLTGVPRTAGHGTGAQSRVTIFRRRGLARALDRACAPGARRPCRRRSTSRPVAADQPVVVPRSRARQTDAAGIRKIRSDVPGRPVGEVDRRISTTGDSNRSQRVAVRSLLDRRGAVQVSRWVVPREIPGNEALTHGHDNPCPKRNHEGHEALVIFVVAF